ncbi:hypothetical protein D9758_005571 [Tetrapyrgos nigripes]|uniref:protein-tyrosine-phosphatase n=1 Tax=Tetrapyrgos nigripes TaxID=182062 RepID=A0A8H5GH25_9AGAR|nr:hypothetical protein D9758_005571 [Tetrapyrgos nigripes]
MSCVQVIMPIVPQPMSLPSMSYRSWSQASSTSSTSAPKPRQLRTPHLPMLLTPSPLSAPSRLPSARTAPSEIIQRLYISDLSFAENPSSLNAYRITHIISVLPDVVAVHPDTHHIHRLQVRVEDLPFAELAARLPQTTAFIRNALQNPHANVLVHCAEGISRSSSVVAAFLIALYGWTPYQAVEYIKSKRNVAEPNFGFVKQLQEYSQSLSMRRGLPEETTRM